MYHFITLATQATVSRRDEFTLPDGSRGTNRATDTPAGA